MRMVEAALPQTSSPRGLRTRVFGIDVDILAREGALDRIAGGWSARRAATPLRAVTANLHHVLLNRSPGPFRDAHAAADLVLADGMPLVWASRLSARRLPERVAGSDLLLPVCQRAAADGASVFVLGTTLPILVRACRRLVGWCPGLRIAGVYAPPFGFAGDHPLSEEAVSMIERCRPDVLFLALGAPRQELWMHAHHARLRVKVVICVGASFDFVAEAQQRAPRLVQRVGLEWLWRLALSPRRLGGRYAAILAMLPVALVEQARAWRRSREGNTG